MMSIAGRLFLLIIFYLLTVRVNAQPNYWSSTNWSSSSRYLYAIASDSSGRIYAATYDAGLYLSTDKGQTWKNLDVPTTHITCLTAGKSNEIFLGTWGDGIYGSSDQGANWKKFTFPATQINRIVLGTNKTIFVSTFADSAVYRSDDYGKNWKVITKGIDFGTIPIGAPSVVTGTGGKVYVMTLSGKIYRSNDNGENWLDTNFPLDNDPMTSDENLITLLTTTSGYVFAAGSGGVFRYKEASQSWETVNAGVQEPKIFVRVLALTKEGYLFRGSEHSYSGTVYISKDNGDHWSDRSSGLPSNAIFGLAIDPDGVIFAALYGSGVYISNSTIITSISNTSKNYLPAFELSQNYPNPFNPTTTINYSIPVDIPGSSRTSLQRVTLKVYDMLGREIAILVNEEKSAGNYEVKFNAANLTSGIYFYSLVSGEYSQTKKLMVIK